MSRSNNYIGPYRLLKLVRAGQTCQIWEVISEVDDRRMALKALQGDRRTDREQIALLKHEYTVGKCLDHPHVIRVYEFNIDKGTPYLVLDYFVSRNMKQWIRDFGSERRELIPAIVERAAMGLGHLHERGWVHRDVKPDNFLINDEADVRLIDFAIARRAQSGIMARMFSRRPPIQGTRSYMSPEQIRGESVEPRSDLYSFGCVVFELVSGRPPFTGGSADELLQKHLRNPAPVLTAGGTDVTPEFSELIARMMAKVPQHRPKSMDQFLEDYRKMRVFVSRQKT